MHLVGFTTEIIIIYYLYQQLQLPEDDIKAPKHVAAFVI